MKKFLFVILAVLVSVALVPCAGAGSTGFNAIRLTPSTDDTYSVEIENTSGTDVFTMTNAGVISMTGTLSGTIADSATTTATGTYDYSGATSFDFAQSFDMGLFNWFKGNVFAPLTTSTDPAVDVASSVPVIAYASNSTASIIYNSIRIPSWMTGSGIAFRALVRFSGSASGTPSKAMNWGIVANGAGSAAGTLMSQASVLIPYTTVASQSELTFTPNATAIAAMTSGKSISLHLAPNSNNTGQAGTLHILSVQAYKP